MKLLGPVLCEFGTPEQKAYFLPRILSGEDIWAQGYSEPGSGSDLASLKTAARLEGDQYVVNGTKIWTTHAHHANWIFCLVRTSNEGRKQQGISFLLVPMDQDGVTITPIMSMSEDHEVNQVFFDNAVTDAKHLIGEEGQGWSIAKYLLENERGGGCSAPRLLQRLEKIRQEANSEASGVNGPMIHDAEFQRRLAKLQLEAEALEFTELRILAEVAKGNTPGPRSSVVKYLTANLGQQIDELHLDLFGYAGLQLPQERPLYGNEAPEAVGCADAQIVMGKYLNSRAATIFGGSNEVQRSIIAKTVLGL